MASVSWQYPEDQLIALRRQNASADAATPIMTGVDIARLRFRYAIEGDNPPWRPVSAFDDGSKVYIEMPSGIAEGEAPPLFVIGPEGDGQLVNYRVRQNYYIVDRLFCNAQNVAPRMAADPTAAAPARTFLESLVTRGRSAPRRMDADRSASLSPPGRMPVSSSPLIAPSRRSG